MIRLDKNPESCDYNHLKSQRELSMLGIKPSMMYLQDEQFLLCSSSSLTTGGSHVLLKPHEHTVIWIYNNEKNPASPSSSTHIHTCTYIHRNPRTDTHFNTQMHAYIYMHVQMHTPTYANTPSRIETVMQIIVLCGCTEFLFNPTFPGLSLCQSLGLSSWLYPSSRDTAEI